MNNKTYSVLFLCTGNSARSILAEALMNRLGEGRFHAYSAGSFPKGEVHPQALSLLDELRFPTEGLRSKSWDEYSGSESPAFDFIFTVCDSAAGETCPVWPGNPMGAHWGIEDPAAVEGPGQREAFERALHFLSNRVSLFLALPHDSIDEMAMERKLKEIGRAAGASTQAGSAE